MSVTINLASLEEDLYDNCNYCDLINRAVLVSRLYQIQKPEEKI
jgi:hypothetical protein